VESKPNATDTPDGPKSEGSCQRTPRRTLRRTLRRTSLGLITIYGAALLTGCNPSVPFDVVYNVGCAPVDPALRVSADAPPQLVVLQHGMWRSSWALWKLERSLRAHGYEVLNTSYPSTQDTIEAHAALLDANIEEHFALRDAERVRPGRSVQTRSAADPEIWFVGHSMGGLVIQAYLRRPNARAAAGCVFLGTPQRGAVMAAKRRGRFWFPILLGDQAAYQLDPADPLHTEPLQNLGDVGTIVGGKGDASGYTDLIPGDDDGRVGITEARCEVEIDSVFLKRSHTRLTIADESILSVLYFLRHRRFDDPRERQPKGS